VIVREGRDMFRNYLTTALRNLVRNRLYAAINIIGLAIGFSAALLIALFIRDELTYDTWVPEYENVYRISKLAQLPGGQSTLRTVGTGQIEALWAKQEIPEIRTAIRLWPELRGVRNAAMDVNTPIVWADAEVLDIFPFKAAEGDIRQALSQADGLVLTRSAARRFFGRENVIGEILEIDHQTAMRVATVMEDLPSRSHLHIEILGSGRASISPFTIKYKEDFSFVGGYTYVKIAPDTLRAVEKGFADITDRHTAMEPYYTGGLAPRGTKASELYVTTLQPLNDIHLISLDGYANSPHHGLLKPTGDIGLLRALAVTAGFILFVALANFVNLMTARASRRAVEVGVRKATGAQRRDLVVQFVGESMLYAAAGLIISAALVTAFLPRFNAFLDRVIALNGEQLSLLPLGLIIFVMAGVLGGLYPAFVLSAFRPAAVLKGGAAGGGGSSILRQSLVIAQFTTLIGLIIATVVIGRQTSFAMQDGLRLDTDQIITIETACPDSFRTQVSALPGVRGAACSNSIIFGGASQVRPSVAPDGSRFALYGAGIDAGLLELYGLKPVAGRFFPEGSKYLERPKDNPSWRRPILINEAAVRAAQFPSAEAALGQGFRDPQGGPITEEVIGVVPDFPFRSLRDPMYPATFTIPRNTAYTMMVVKLDGARVGETLAAIDKAWNTLATGRPIMRQFYDERVQAQYRDIVRQTQAFAAFSAAAIFVACLGLFGLSAFTAEQRTKEIGIRKAMGARTDDVLRLLVWQFCKPVLWANVIAWPAAYYFMQRWLEGFAARIDLSPGIFLAASGTALSIAVLTISGHAFLVARAQPVAALRYE